jgi:hypothetical protein
MKRSARSGQSEGPSWRYVVRAAQAQKRRRFTLLMLAGMVLWLGASAAGWWLWTVLFHQRPPLGIALGAFASMGSVLGAAFYRHGPALPFHGKAPEEAAAQAFFAGSDVRSDDDEFEQDLKP